jgi:ATP-dependent RNA helicase DDX10/DBP4
MFSRKNQDVLSKPYRQLIAHSHSSNSEESDDDDEFITLKRANHDLPSSSSSHHTANLSNRKLKLSSTKKALLKSSYTNLSKKLVFDDAGKAHELYEMADAEEVYGKDGGVEGVMHAGRVFVEEERGKMKETDIIDKREAREKKQERKRKRKEREKGVCITLSIIPSFKADFRPFLILG